jgi:hypothetical protein
VQQKIWLFQKNCTSSVTTYIAEDRKLIVLVREDAWVYWNKDPAPTYVISVMKVVCRVIYQIYQHQQQLKLQYGLSGLAVRPFCRPLSSS